MAAEHNKPEILATEVVAQSRLFKIESLDLRFSNGVERTYERMKPSGTPCSIGRTGDRAGRLVIDPGVFRGHRAL